MKYYSSEWKYEATKLSGFFRADGEPLRYSVRRYRVTDTLDLGGVPGLGGMDEIEVDPSYRHGTSYDTRKEARVAARALNMVRVTVKAVEVGNG